MSTFISRIFTIFTPLSSRPKTERLWGGEVEWRDPESLSCAMRRQGEVEWRDSDNLSRAMPNQGILTTNRGPQAPSPASLREVSNPVILTVVMEKVRARQDQMSRPGMEACEHLLLADEEHVIRLLTHLRFAIKALIYFRFVTEHISKLVRTHGK